MKIKIKKEKLTRILQKDPDENYYDVTLVFNDAQAHVIGQVIQQLHGNQSLIIDQENGIWHIA